MKPAVFFDRDGTLIENIAYNINPSRLRLREGVSDCLLELQARGSLLIVVSNQDGISRGIMSVDDMLFFQHSLEEKLLSFGVRLDAFYYCPHQVFEACGCRKPAPGMLLRAAREHHIDMSASWMVGDILNDIEAGARAGCRTVLLDVGSETEWIESSLRIPSSIAYSFAQVQQIIAPDLLTYERVA